MVVIARAILVRCSALRRPATVQQTYVGITIDSFVVLDDKLRDLPSIRHAAAELAI
jgi:hypothetical protein